MKLGRWSAPVGHCSLLYSRSDHRTCLHHPAFPSFLFYFIKNMQSILPWFCGLWTILLTSPSTSTCWTVCLTQWFSLTTKSQSLLDHKRTQPSSTRVRSWLLFCEEVLQCLQHHDLWVCVPVGSRLINSPDHSLGAVTATFEPFSSETETQGQ